MTPEPAPAAADRLTGHRMPGGLAVVEPWRHWLTADAVLAPPTRSGVAHPMSAYFCAMSGAGLTVAELFALMQVGEDAGVLLAECSLEIAQPLLVGRTYRVEGAVTQVRRTSGRRSGPLDLVTMSFALAPEPADGDAYGDDAHATCTVCWAVPRSGSG